MTAPETITVRWAGVEHEVFCYPGWFDCTVGPVSLACGPVPAGAEWIASVRQADDHATEGYGPTAQAALDDLAAKLRALAAWALATVGEGVAADGSAKQ